MTQPTANIWVRRPTPEDRPLVRTGHLYLHVDETAFPAAGEGEVFGVGVLSCPEPVSQNVVDCALAKLRSDRDRDPASPNFRQFNERLDLATLARGHFHASFDSKNAHSPLAEEIRRAVAGNFVFSFARLGTQGERREFRRHTVRAILTALQTREPVTCVFEQRSGLSVPQALEIVEHMNRGLDWMAYQQTMMRAYYPAISVAISDKSNPGLQVTDMLLWAIGQSLFHAETRKATWAERCGLFRWSDAEVPQAPLRWVQCTLNSHNPQFADEPDHLVPYPVRFDDVEEGVDNNELANVYMAAERVVRHFAAAPLPPHAEHLHSRALLSSLADPDRVGPDEIRQLASAFLRLFDTVPVYDGIAADDPAWLKLVRAKRFLGLTLRQDLFHGVGTADFFTVLRRNNVRQNPAVFGLS